MSELPKNSKWPHPLAKIVLLTLGMAIFVVLLTRLVLRLAS